MLAAQSLDGRYEFQYWALSLIDAQPVGDRKKGADSGIDGRITFTDAGYTTGGDVTITGNGLSTGCTPDASGSTSCAAVQIIVADTWDVGGAGVLQMPYDPSKFFNPMMKGLVR